MDLIGNVRLGLRAALLSAAVLMLAGIVVPTAYAAEGERQLDPLLSLIGGCANGKEEPLDPVEDPGCPGTPPATSNHPPAIFAAPKAVTTDFYGNIYVSNFGKLASGTQGRVDIFDSAGQFISELKTPGPTSLAVDSEGILYVLASIDNETDRELLRFEPCGVYAPAEAKIEYCGPPVSLPIGDASFATYAGLAINVANDHLFANFSSFGVWEFDSAENGNTLLRKAPLPTAPFGVGVAVDAQRGKLYASAGWGAEPLRIDIFDLNQAEGTPPNETYKKVGSIEGSAVPTGAFLNYLSVAVDEATGHVFVLDGDANRVYEFDEGGTYLATIENGFAVTFGAEIGIDNGPFSPNGALSGTGRYLYVPSGKTGTGHSFAFSESNVGAPKVVSVDTAGLSENEAELQAVINPGNLETSYTFEYTTEQQFEEEGFANASIAGSGKLPAGNLEAEAAAVLTDLEDGTSYRFRVVVINEEGSDEAEGAFGTYPSVPVTSSSCGNALLRVGLSASLPDCRAYELVTPPDTNGRAPVGTGHELQFTNRQVSPDGNRIPFKVEGGSIGGSDVTGSYLGDPYLSTRGPDGWGTDPIGPTGAEAQGVIPGGTSPDQGYSFWTAEVGGSATDEGGSVGYLRFPDGHSEVLGEGSLGTDPAAYGLLISEGGDHVIFSTVAAREQQKVTVGAGTTGGTFTLSFEGQSTGPIAYDASVAEVGAALEALPNIGSEGVSVSGSGGGPYTVRFDGPLGGLDVPQLGADASSLIPSGVGQVTIATTQSGGGRLEPAASETEASIYDRTPDGTTHVISVLPGDVPPNANAVYRGASLDGEGVAFTVGSTLYLRYQNDETLEVGDGVTFAGVAEGGSRVFYMEGGQLWRFDAEAGVPTAFSAGAVTPVNIAEDGGAAYFVSTEVLTGAPNPNGDDAQAGEENLYLSEEGAISFVGTLTEEDVAGEAGKVEKVEGLGLWVGAVGPPTVGRLGVDPSRSTPDGSTLIFRSRAALTDYDPDGHPQIYRYDSAESVLQCLSCNPTGAVSTGAATLQSESREGFPLFFPQAWLRNLRPDGLRAFFESPDALVPADTDSKLDVYEWEAQGVGSCTRSEGCVYLISSAHSFNNEYLYAISESGDDVFFLSSDRISPRDADGTPSIYDARVDGGFPEPVSPECQGEGCRPQLTPPPDTPDPQTPVYGDGDNFEQPRRCPKGKHKVKRGGKVKCVKKKKGNKHQAGTEKKGGRK